MDKNILANHNPQLILKKLYKRMAPIYISELVRESNTHGEKLSWSGTANNVYKLEKLNLVRKEKKGKLAMITLTELGAMVAKHLVMIDRLMGVKNGK